MLIASGSTFCWLGGGEGGETELVIAMKIEGVKAGDRERESRVTTGFHHNRIRRK